MASQTVEALRAEIRQLQREVEVLKTVSLDKSDLIGSLSRALAEMNGINLDGRIRQSAAAEQVEAAPTEFSAPGS